MSHFPEDPEGELQADPTNEEPVKGRGQTLAVCLLSVFIGSGLALLWHYYTDEIYRLMVTLQLPHWLIVAGGVLVIVGTIGVLVSGRRRGDAPPEPSRREAAELQDREPNS